MNQFWDDMIPRLIGLLVAFLVTYAAKYGISLDAQELTALFVAIYAIVHRAVTAGRDTHRATRAVQARDSFGRKGMVERDN